MAERVTRDPRLDPMSTNAQPQTQPTPAHSTPLGTTPTLHQPNSQFHTTSALAKHETD